MEFYRRGQFGRILAGLFVLGFILAMAGTFFRNGNGTDMRSLLLAEGLLFLAFVVFTRITIRVTEEFVEARFGPGFPKKRVLLDEIAHIEETDIPWYALGIKRMKGGWAWGVAPGPALDLKLKNGRVVRLGTDDPDGLLDALEKASGRSLRTPS